jgi:hypothetical protein
VSYPCVLESDEDPPHPFPLSWPTSLEPNLAKRDSTISRLVESYDIDDTKALLEMFVAIVGLFGVLNRKS